MHGLVPDPIRANRPATRPLLRALLAFPLFIQGLSTSAHCQPSANWRVYSSVDGLRESFSRAVSVGPSGKVWINHGRVDRMSVLDGYGCSQLPSPGPNLKVREAPDSEIWAFKGEGWPPVTTGLQRFSRSESRWISWEIPEIKNAPGLNTGNFVPLDRDHVLFLVPEALLQFSAVERKTSVAMGRTSLGKLLYLTAAPDGGFWVGAERGLGLYHPGRPDVWKEQRLPGELKNLVNLHAQTSGELIASATEIASGKSVLVRYLDGEWKILYRTSAAGETVQGWRSPEGGYWVARTLPETFSLLRIGESEVEEEAPTKALSGSLMDVAVAPDGTFWLGTTHSLSHCAPFAWRTPAPVSDLLESVTSVVETAPGRLYFLYVRHLVLLDGHKWKRYRFPEGLYVPSRQMHGMALLSDGRLAIPSNSRDLLLFDPVRERFEKIRHPKGDSVAVIRPAKGGAVWLAAPITDGKDYRLETFDGRDFRVRLEVRGVEVTVTRDVCETSSGDLWVMGQGGDGIGVLHAGRFRTFRKEDGFLWNGSFFAMERADGKVWFGDRDGVLQFDGREWKMIHKGTETVRAMITARDGSVWVGSGSGIHRYADGSWMGINANDGLPDTAAMTVFEDTQGFIWVGTTRGLSRYYPEADRKPPKTSVPEENNLRKTPPGGEVHFVFSGRDYWRQTEEDRLLYSYRIDGQSWSPYQSQGNASARGLSAGNHVFEVRAMDRNWNVDPWPARFEFTVLKSWYLETGFIWMAALGALVLGYLLRSHVIRHFNLGRLVNERTSELTSANEQLRREIAERERAWRENQRLEEQLRQSQKMEAIGRLSGGIAHDFNNLLTVINGYTSLIQTGLKQEDPLRAMAEEVGKAGERAAGLIRQLLAFSRKQVLDPSILDLNAVIREMDKMLRSLIGEDIRLMTSLDPDIGFIKADSGQIQQVLMNLAANARDAMRSGGTLAICTRNAEVNNARGLELGEPPPGSYVLLAVTDTGPGMDEQTQAQIFEPFFTTKERGRGTGLGLATVYGIVKQSDGHISVSSSPGNGATFSIFLPRVQGVREIPDLKQETPATVMRGSETVLVVEDQDEVRKLACSALRSAGYDVLEAASGEEALEVVREHSGTIHLLLTDAVMPGITGRQVAEQMKLVSPATKVLIISGYSADLAGASFPDSDTAYLQKPFTPSVLTDKVRAVLGPC